MNIAKKALVFTSAVAIAAGTSVPGTSVSAKTRLSGAGASFPAKIYTRWFFDLAKSGGPRVNYQAVGSGSGRKAFIDQTVNFLHIHYLEVLEIYHPCQKKACQNKPQNYHYCF